MTLPEALAKLNPQQRAAVEAIDGPVMVLAGPGTGKTQVIATRIAYILSQTDTPAKSILALTFTESGVTAMRERLVELIGPTAYEVAVYTFHGLANRVINESGAEFYRSHTLRELDDISKFHLVTSLLSEGNFLLLRPPKNPSHYVKPILDAIKNLKTEAISPEQLTARVNEAIDELRRDEANISSRGPTKGQLKQSVARRIHQYERTLELAEVFARYETVCESTGRYDYEDMILFVLKKFEESPDLLLQYQERYLYVLVDEYQDTNNAQNQLVRSFTEHVEQPNICVVGDDKQSIYRFQGASTANIVSFLEWFPQTKIISLTQNYRSGQPILDAADRLIANNTHQLSNTLPTIQTKLTGQHINSKVYITTYSNPDHELLGCVEKVEEAIERKVALNDIAILVRRNSEVEDFANILARKKIPFTLESGESVLADPFVSQLVSLARLAADPLDNQAMFRFMQSPYSGIRPSDLIAINRQTRGIPLYETMTQSRPPKGIQADWPAWRRAAKLVESWFAAIQTTTVAQLVERLLYESGLLAYVLKRSDSLTRTNRLRAFFNDVKQLTADNPQAGLADLFARCDLRQTYGLPIVAPPLGDIAGGAIRVITAHRAKGLEFDTVIIPNVIEGNWSRSVQNEKIILPSGLVPHNELTDDEAIEEERRLFYVALTRAKRAAHISFASRDRSNADRTASQFIAEIDSQATHQTAKKLNSIATLFEPITDEFIADLERHRVADIVRNHPISPTGLNTFLSCPREYLYKDIYQAPALPSPTQLYGTAIHRALEEWGKWRKARTKVGVNDVLAIFDNALAVQTLGERDRTAFGELGREVLKSYVDRFGDRMVAPLAVEYSFGPHKVLLHNRIPITGKLDLIEPIAGSNLVRVVDYKTGRVRSRNQILGQTDGSDEDYIRQLVFYTILAKADPAFPFKVGEVELRFIDDDKKFTSETFTITDAQRDNIAGLISDMYDETCALNFPHTPHQKTHFRTVSLCDMYRQ